MGAERRIRARVACPRCGCPRSRCFVLRRRPLSPPWPACARRPNTSRADRGSSRVAPRTSGHGPARSGARVGTPRRTTRTARRRPRPARSRAPGAPVRCQAPTPGPGRLARSRAPAPSRPARTRPAHGGGSGARSRPPAVTMRTSPARMARPYRCRASQRRPRPAGSATSARPRTCARPRRSSVRASASCVRRPGLSHTARSPVTISGPWQRVPPARRLLTRCPLATSMTITRSGGCRPRTSRPVGPSAGGDEVLPVAVAHEAAEINRKVAAAALLVMPPLRGRGHDGSAREERSPPGELRTATAECGSGVTPGPPACASRK